MPGPKAVPSMPVSIGSIVPALDELSPVCLLEAAAIGSARRRSVQRAPRAISSTMACPRIMRERSRRFSGCCTGEHCCFDRDGVVNVDYGHVGSRDRFEWMPWAREAMQAATESGWYVFVVTNQSGVAHG